MKSPNGVGIRLSLTGFWLATVLGLVWDSLILTVLTRDYSSPYYNPD